eukprot:TRINITY_DN1762_c0_g1_i1.p1 TRINITY_DN1762_c0_g1~~TRINITY_DN1762_c0_g1_i1.p1  ORF type:complete len:601 (-),score=101.47 TRINITY_DN1762_c0_g1_i1:52-1587(-)
MHEVIDCARELLRCERCSLFLVDASLNELCSLAATNAHPITFPLGKGIAGWVARTGETVNAENAYLHPQFNPEIDVQTGFRTRSILAMPLKLEEKVVAVIEAINKTTGAFTVEDEETLKTFSHFAGMAIRNTLLYEFTAHLGRDAVDLYRQRPQRRYRHIGSSILGARKVRLPTAAELNHYRGVTPSQQELAALDQIDFPSQNYLPNSEDHDKLVPLIVTMFKRLDFPKKYGIPEDVLWSLVTTVKLCYRSVPYHNFTHAFDVTQMMYVFIVTGELQSNLTDLELFVLMTSALLHDVDHMGLNNAFHLKAKTPLGILTAAAGAKSVLEIHHCKLAIDILSDPTCNIFCGISEPELTEAYRLMVDTILATDMARHDEICNELKDLAVGPYSKENPEHRRMAMMVLMKAADISNITRPFDISKVWGGAITEEFYAQGDAERSCNMPVTPMFDRSQKKEISETQLGFINYIGVKFFNLASQFLPAIAFTRINLEKNRAEWQRMVDALKAASSTN